MSRIRLECIDVTKVFIAGINHRGEGNLRPVEVDSRCLRQEDY